MPGKNGYEVCEAIKTDPSLSAHSRAAPDRNLRGFRRGARRAGGRRGPRLQALRGADPGRAGQGDPRPSASSARCARCSHRSSPRPSLRADDSSFDFFEDNLDDFADAIRRPLRRPPTRTHSETTRRRTWIWTARTRRSASETTTCRVRPRGSDLDAMLEPERPMMDAAADRTMAMDAGRYAGARLPRPPRCSIREHASTRATSAAGAGTTRARSGSPSRPSRPSTRARTLHTLSSRDMAQAAIIDPEVAADLAVSSSDLVSSTQARHRSPPPR